jgi:hypothetical protein
VELIGQALLRKVKSAFTEYEARVVPSLKADSLLKQGEWFQKIRGSDHSVRMPKATGACMDLRTDEKK